MFKKPWFIVLFANTMVVLLTLTITISIHLYNIYLRKPDPKPKITYSEFPISITYEIDGEVKKFEDVIICEYGGTKHVGLGVTHRIWNVKLKSGKKSPIIFYKVRKGNKTYNITKDMLGNVSIVDIVTDSKLCASKSESRRMIEGGGIYLNENKVTDIRQPLLDTDLTDNYAILRKGKKNYMKVVVE